MLRVLSESFTKELRDLNDPMLHSRVKFSWVPKRQISLVVCQCRVGQPTFGQICVCGLYIFRLSRSVIWRRMNSLTLISAYFYNLQSETELRQPICQRITKKQTFKNAVQLKEALLTRSHWRKLARGSYLLEAFTQEVGCERRKLSRFASWPELRWAAETGPGAATPTRIARLQKMASAEKFKTPRQVGHRSRVA